MTLTTEHSDAPPTTTLTNPTILEVGFDLDGVIYPLVPGLRHYAHVSRGIPLENMPDPTVYDFGPEWGMTHDEFVALMHEAVNAEVLFDHGDPLPGAREAMAAVRAAGHNVHIITSRFLGRYGIAEWLTLRWLARHDLPYDTITFSEDKTTPRTDVYVDDLPRHYDALNAAGTTPVLMDATYNQDPACTRTRVTTLAEYGAHVANLAAARPN